MYKPFGNYVFGEQNGQVDNLLPLLTTLVPTRQVAHGTVVVLTTSYLRRLRVVYC